MTPGNPHPHPDPWDVTSPPWIRQAIAHINGLERHLADACAVIRAQQQTIDRLKAEISERAAP